MISVMVSKTPFYFSHQYAGNSVVKYAHKNPCCLSRHRKLLYSAHAFFFVTFAISLEKLTVLYIK